MTEFPSGANRITVSEGGGRQPRWREDEVFFVQEDTLFAARVTTEPELTVTTPAPLFSDPDLVSSRPMQQYDVTPNGQHFVMVESIGGSRDTVIHVVQNWYEEFRDRE